MEKDKIAFLMIGIADLTGGGGAERFFADLFAEYTQYSERKYELHIITDNKSFQNLRKIGRLIGVNNVVIVDEKHKLFHPYFNPFPILRTIYELNINLIHIGLISPVYLPLIWLLNMSSEVKRSKIAITITDCGVANTYFSPIYKYRLPQLKINLLYRIFLKMIKTDGLLSWYQLFKKIFSDKYIHGNPVIRSIN